MSRFHRLIPMLACLPLLLAGALTMGSSASADDRLQLVATTGMIADVVREVGGEQVEVRGLMGPGVDPHLYRQTRSDVTAMTRADAVFWNGLYLEAQLESFLERLGGRQPVIAVGEAVPREARLADEQYPDQHDPHVWMDPGRWRHAVEAIRDALVEMAPAHAEAFAERAEAYLEELEALDAYAREVLSSVPEEARVLVTAHDAFGYFGDAYGFEVLGIQGYSTESEAGLARIESLVRMLVERDLGALFVETSVSDRNVRALVEGAAARGHEVRIGGELYSDAMGPEGSYEGTWLGMLDHNVSQIAIALGGEVPEGGRLGRLSHLEEAP
ncbi:metal ABC transporter solute-binding protein, Zn/Mn family [Halomonas sp. HK25]|uniref:metal ABC transporter solute-binding protein, Zn/Mn family n=1 Tax=Halomonas sp. HK25 TaxID=3394321 RepID=UPI0039FD8658